jgi:hypothetical protein
MGSFPLSRIVVFVFFLGLIPQILDGQSQTTTTAQTRDPQAIGVLQQSVVTMGSTVPSDSTATGTITTVAGSLTESGAITIHTRGTDQSSEQIHTPHGSTAIYSQGQASNTLNSITEVLPMERAVTSQCPDFPLALLAGALNNPDTAYKYIDLETIEGVSAHHIQFWNSFASTPKLQSLAKFSIRDVWIDAKSELPLKIFYVRRDGGGATPGIAMESAYSDYRNVNGVLYPFSIQKSMNGTGWATITIHSVVLNTGLTEANFAVETGVAQ